MYRYTDKENKPNLNIFFLFQNMAKYSIQKVYHALFKLRIYVQIWHIFPVKKICDHRTIRPTNKLTLSLL